MKKYLFFIFNITLISTSLYAADYPISSLMTSNVLGCQADQENYFNQLRNISDGRPLYYRKKVLRVSNSLNIVGIYKVAIDQSMQNRKVSYDFKIRLGMNLSLIRLSFFSGEDKYLDESDEYAGYYYILSGNKKDINTFLHSVFYDKKDSPRTIEQTPFGNVRVSCYDRG